MILRNFMLILNILRCRSKYFDNIISDKNIEKKDENIYLYADYVDITDKIGTELLNIIIASDELNLENLTRFTKDYIVEHRQLLQNDPVGALQTVFYYESLINLRDLCLETICIEPENFFNSNKFTQLSGQLLEIILKREDLNIEEIEIWEIS
ncbi:unnamed protein product [Rhizophagus irregularis]|nr:unnamed protein product [Rhizophagus irregularis]